MPRQYCAASNFTRNVLLLDLRLPDLPAATTCARVRERMPQTAIVILTAFPEEMAVRSCLEAGAAACLFKDVDEQALLWALMQVVHGRTVIDSRIAGAALPRLTRDGTSFGELLTGCEREVLHLIAKGLTTRASADEAGLSPNTVKSHLKSLYAKLGVHNRVQALAAARERGLA